MSKRSYDSGTYIEPEVFSLTKRVPKNVFHLICSYLLEDAATIFHWFDVDLTFQQNLERRILTHYARKMWRELGEDLKTAELPWSELRLWDGKLHVWPNELMQVCGSRTLFPGADPTPVPHIKVKNKCEVKLLKDGLGRVDVSTRTTTKIPFVNGCTILRGNSFFRTDKISAYCELEVPKDMEENDMISFGIVTEEYNWHMHQIGWRNYSVGWHSDDSGLFICETMHTLKTNRKFSGVVGCGVEIFEDHRCVFFYTKRNSRAFSIELF